MSIFDDIADAGRAVAHTVAGAAEDVAHSTFGHTVEELGGAVAAPVTALLDVAQFPFEVPQKGIGNAFHQLVHNEANEGLKLVKPFTDGDTYTGKVFTGVTGAMNTAWSKAIDQPLATLAYATEHASMNGDLGEQWATLFDGSTWSKAYDIAKQDDSGLAFGKSLVPILFSDDGKDIDPFNRNDLASLQQKHQTAGNILGVGATLGIGWVADPSVVLGKTLGISMQSRYLAKLGATDRAAMLAKISPGENLTGVGAFRANRYSNRVDGHWDFISGDNKLGKPLSAMEIHASSPELQRAPSGLEIASAMSRAARQGDKQMYKMIVAATAGDPGAIMALHDQSAAGRVVADTFKNILSGGPIDLETHALNEWARFDPTMFAEYQRQLGNQDAAGDLTKFAKDWSARVDHRVADMRQVVANRGALDYVPARHDQMFGLNNPFSKSNNALKRVNEDRLIDKGAAFHDRVQERAAEIAAAPRQSLWQQGLSQVPLLLVKGTNPATGWYTGRYEKGIMDALRGQHYIGKVELHDWSGSLRQLDAMLRLSKVETAKRLQVLDIAGRAVTEGEKNQATQIAIQTAFRGLADHYSPKLGGKTIDQGFINSVVTKNMLKAKASQTAFAPQVYGATPLPQSMLDRPDIADAIAGARQQADEALANGSQEWGAEGVEHNAWRVDQVDEHGSLVSLPLFESQLRNTIMLPDLHSMDTALSREVTHHRLADWSAAWKKQADELSLLRARRMHAAGSALDRIDKLILAKQQMMDGLTDAGTLAVRAWKASVLLRLGYPQRVLADDHLRISNKLHWMREMVAPNVAEGTKNVYYNRAPAFLPGSRDAEALKAWKQARFERRQMEQALGLRGKSADDLKEISRAYDTKNMVGPVDEARLARADKALADLDPEGHVAEWFDHRAKAKTLQRQIMGKRNAIKRAEGDAARSHTIDKMQQDIARLEARRDYHISQMPDRDPFEARKEIDDLLDAERQGWRAFVPEKRRLGSKDVKLKGIDDNLQVDANATTSAEGSIGAHGKHYQALTSSEGTFDELAFGPEGRHSQDQRVGAWKTFHPADDAYSEAWADVLNHQVRNSRLAMHILKNRDASVEDIAAWLREPEQVDLRDRVAHYAKDPLDWAGRVHALIHEYVPSDDVADLLLKGEVKPQQLERAVPTEARPVIHGKSLDYNTGRSAAAQSLGNAYRSIFKVIGEMPTDTLSRHPFFNAMYKKELQEIADTNIEYAKLTGKDRFTESDIHDWESTARRKALGHLKATLWDISAHSHAGHVMRYLSPFFTAHVESLSRWWRIAQDDPSAIRKFEMAFDAPRNLGLVYDQSTGDPVKPGDPITSNHRITFRFPSTHIPVVDKFLKAVGGDRNLSVGENGLNIILQNGIANPGTGPMVTVPVTELAKKYASDPSITKFANMVNPYPQDSVVGGLEPSTLRKTMDYFKGLHNDTSDVAYAQAYATNLNEAIADYQRKHGGADPIGKAMDHIVDAAGKEAQHDLLIEALWSWGGFTPSRVEGKYAAIQRGWQQIQAVGRAQGKDYDWMRNKFKEKYHGAYMPMLYSSSDNPARLDSTPGTVSAVAKYRGLVKHLDDARTVRIIAGPAAAMNATHDPASGEFTKEARLWLQNQHVLGSGDALLNTRNPKQQAIAGMIGEGWDAYTQAMNQLNTAAMANGASLTSAAVQQVKQSLIAQIGAKNPQWAQDYQERIGLGNQWPSVMQDLRRIASNKALTNDPERGDVKILGDYIGLRDQVQGVLDALKAKGLPHTPGAKALAPLFQMFQQKVDQMRQDNTYFDDYTFNGLVEFDPFYRAALTGGN